MTTTEMICGDELEVMEPEDLDVVSGGSEGQGRTDGGAPDGGAPSTTNTRSSTTSKSVSVTFPGLGTREATETTSTVVTTRTTPCPGVWQGVPYK